MQTAIPQYTPIQPGDRVVCAGSPFIAWLRAHDTKHFPRRRYDYDTLPPRSDKLDRWLWARSEVVGIVGNMARLKSFLGETRIPIHCLRRIPYSQGMRGFGD